MNCPIGDMRVGRVFIHISASLFLSFSPKQGRELSRHTAIKYNTKGKADRLLIEGLFVTKM